MKAAAAVALIASALCGALALRACSHRVPTHLTGDAPPIMLWAWEEPEDLRTLDSRRAGVAFLAERVFLGSAAQAIFRHQSIRLPKDSYVVAVVRLEATRDFADTPELRAKAASAILRAAALPQIRGLQVDFDASFSQQAFYTDILRRVRAQISPAIDLSVTALVSSCAQPNGFLHNLPVDAAVPMYFRLGRHAGAWGVREPLCAGSLGQSIDEPQSAPAASAVQRRYLFAPHPWTAGELAAINRNQIPIPPPGAR